MTDTRALTRMVLQDGWTATAAADPAEVEQAIAEIEATLPLAQTDRKLNGPETNAIADALRPIGAKLAPSMSHEQAVAWRCAVVLALSDLPARIALYGVRKAIHRPMQFLNEVDGVAREYANEALDRQRNALHRLKRMRAEIERAANPQPKLEAPPMDWTEESVAEANDLFARVGVTTRYRLNGNEVDVLQPGPDEREAERQRNFKEQKP